MTAFYKTRIVKLGNTQGIEIPQQLLDESGIESEVEVYAEHHRLIIKSPLQPRLNWEQALKTMATNQDDVLLDDDIPTDWDKTE